MSNKIKLGVIFGGKSEEHVVSIMSAKSILKNVCKEKFEVYPIAICRNGVWVYLQETFHAINSNEIDEIDFGALIKKYEEKSSIEAISMLEKHLDVVFPVLHGPFGEDGTIQGLFEMMNIPYVGANVIASALCMDKVYSKQLLFDAGIKVVDSYSFVKRQFIENQEYILDTIQHKFAYPIFIKPANLGSSVGISKVVSQDDLKNGILEALKYDDKVLVEQGVDCREIECAVFGNQEPIASVVGEILPSHDFYDFEAKYFDDGKSTMVIPADVSEATQTEIQQIALKAYAILGITGLSRIDFFVDKKSQAIYLNEINTMPGFTKFSMFPLLCAESGIPYPDLIEKLIDLAIERKNDQKEKRI